MFDLTSNTTLITGLAAAALNPGLRSILMLDAPYSGLQQVAAFLAELLRTVTGRQVKLYHLGPFESDDDVWGGLDLTWHNAGPGAFPTQRLFSAERNARELQLIIIPDLTTLTLVAARSVTMLVGTDVAHLERNGASACWHPQQCWIAGCESEAIGQLSPHLLDRFVLRFSWKELIPSAWIDEEAAAAHLLASVPREPMQETVTVPAAYLRLVEQAARRQVDVPQAELASVLDYLPTESYYPRREITLARFALALAQLSGDSTLRHEYIDRAATMLGFTRTSPREMLLGEDASLAGEDEEAEETLQPAGAAVTLPPVLSPEPEQPATARLPSTIYTGLLQEGTLCSKPYPEDGAPIEREEAALQWPPLRYEHGRLARGAIIGTEESDDFYDLAPVSTLLNAMKFQSVRQELYRQQHGERYPGLLIERMDLRRYRRSHPLEQVFLLLIDYTSTHGKKNWEDALLPYLRAAYVTRAGVIVIKVGAAGAISPLRAEVVRAKNILVPRVGLALAAERGQATPLAHGLSLALQELQHALQHGRGTARKATLVVISDGRGNVPLTASIHGESKGIVTREGIDDALREAHKIRALKHVETIVLDLQPDYYPDLPERLAEALGTTALPIATSTTKQVLEEKV